METDKLKELVKPYEAAAIRMGFVVFKAEDLNWLYSSGEDFGESGNTTVAYWHDSETFEQFLEVGAAISAKLLYLEAREFTWNDFVDNISDLSSLSKEEISKRQKLAQEFKPYDGFIEHLALAFQRDGIWHAFLNRASWVPKYEELLEEEEELEDTDEETYVLEEEDLDKLARRLANSAGFAKLKNKTDQLSLARKFFVNEPKGMNEYYKDIVDRARVIYQTEIKQ